MGTLRDTEYIPPTPKRLSLAFGKTAINRGMRNMIPSMFRRRSQPNTPEISESEEAGTSGQKVSPKLVFRSGSGSSSEMSSGLLTPGSGSSICIDIPSTSPSISSSSSSSPMSRGFFSKWKKGIRPMHRATPQRHSLGVLERDIDTDGINLRTADPRDILPRLTLLRLQETETPLELLRRYIYFDDEFCIARTGILFNTIRPSCENQVVSVEFHTVNTWVDRTDYSQASDSQCVIRDHLDDSGVAQVSGENPMNDEPIVAKVVTSLCFIPGLEMDPESAIYEDETYIRTEPQSLAECRVGQTYFQWQETRGFQGHLFYLTEGHQWKEAWFCIVGSKLWQCCRPPSAFTPTSSSLPPSQVSSTDPDVLEKLRFLDLETVRYIETEVQVFKATPRHLDDESLTFCNDMDEIEDFGETFSPIKHSFRLRMRAPEQRMNDSDPVSWTTVTQNFYAGSEDMAQAWMESLRVACRSRPPRPYWLR
ncbi:hypothetical protein BGZ65_010283 [Modicella reniformis]|uniref:PH domain-containing protein n=1 Tax=Modicella reniformis TaxID=1440133 RepID=A0A9P6SNT7_9FUNG|nr:hypothetical protein BGZ65_010283 [Modicella reniformis]